MKLLSNKDELHIFEHNSYTHNIPTLFNNYTIIMFCTASRLNFDACDFTPTLELKKPSPL